MPFTPSHAVVALPFVRTPLVPAAVAVGAMTPDFPLFVRAFPLGYGLTHDAWWLPATMILALALLLVWRCVLRPAIRELSPEWLARRLPGEWDGGLVAGWRETMAIGSRTQVRDLVLLAAALAIGVLSHIAWDVFTHEGRWGVSLLPVLDEQWGPLTGVKWLQHGSSVFGLIVLAIFAALWLRRRVPGAMTRVAPAWVRRVWWVSLPAVLVGTWVWGLLAFGPLDAEFTVAHLAYRVLPPACAVWAAATLVLAVVVQVLRARRDVAERR